MPKENRTEKTGSWAGDLTALLNLLETGPTPPGEREYTTGYMYIIPPPLKSMVFELFVKGGDRYCFTIHLKHINTLSMRIIIVEVVEIKTTLPHKVGMAHRKMKFYQGRLCSYYKRILRTWLYH